MTPAQIVAAWFAGPVLLLLIFYAATGRSVAPGVKHPGLVLFVFIMLGPITLLIVISRTIARQIEKRRNEDRP